MPGSILDAYQPADANEQEHLDRFNAQPAGQHSPRPSSLDPRLTTGRNPPGLPLAVTRALEDNPPLCVGSKPTWMVSPAPEPHYGCPLCAHDEIHATALFTNVYFRVPLQFVTDPSKRDLLTTEQPTLDYFLSPR